jgi:hypothetical protein
VLDDVALLRAVMSAESRAEGIVRDMPTALAPFVTRRGENARETTEPVPRARSGRKARSAS